MYHCVCRSFLKNALHVVLIHNDLKIVYRTHKIMSLYETPAKTETPHDDLSSYYASPRGGGVRIGWDKASIFKIVFQKKKKNVLLII